MTSFAVLNVNRAYEFHVHSPHANNENPAELREFIITKHPPTSVDVAPLSQEERPPEVGTALSTPSPQ